MSVRTLPRRKSIQRGRMDASSTALKAAIASRIRELREKGLRDKTVTQKELGQATKISDKYVSNIENAVNWPPLEWIVRMHSQYGVDPNYILLGRIDGLPAAIAERLRRERDTRAQGD
jgi:transcriptional regulator with XRE-family HTH domain